MWTTINVNDFDEYIDSHKSLKDFRNEIQLFNNGKTIILPRHFNKNYPHEKIKILKKNTIFSEVDIKFNGILRPIQEKCSKVILDVLKKENKIYGILKLFPSAGKTVLSFWLASILKYKTCIIVNNDVLLKQWISELIKFTNITENDIGIIKEKVFSTDKIITIASVQTLISKMKSNFKNTFDKISKGNYGLVIYDEVHSSSSSEEYSKSTILFETENIIGLSATPFHYGLSEILMNNTIGNIIFETNDYDLVPEYYFVYYKSGLKNLEITTAKNKKNVNISTLLSRMPDLNIKRAIYNKYILNSQSYINLILKYIRNLTSNEYRTLVICSKRDQVDLFYDLLIKNNIPARKVYGGENYVDKLNDINLIATSKSVTAGFDMPSLSCLIIASPYSGKKSIFQMCGRILRIHPDKKAPMVIDLIDVDFPSLFLSDVKKKKKMLAIELSNECKLIDYNEEEESLLCH